MAHDIGIMFISIGFTILYGFVITLLGAWFDANYDFPAEITGILGVIFYFIIVGLILL